MIGKLINQFTALRKLLDEYIVTNGDVMHFRFNV